MVHCTANGMTTKPFSAYYSDSLASLFIRSTELPVYVAAISNETKLNKHSGLAGPTAAQLEVFFSYDYM